MELFDIIKALFKSDNEWSKVSKIDKSRNFFMINRIMSIQHPLQANMLNNIKIDSVSAVEWWRFMMRKLYKTTPKWIYTSTIKKESEKKDKEYKAETLDLIREKYEVSNRELETTKKFFPKKFDEWIRSIEEHLI